MISTEKVISNNEFFQAFFDLETHDFNRFKIGTLKKIALIVKYDDRTIIVNEENQNINFFIILKVTLLLYHPKGQVNVYKYGELTHELKVSHYFGEECLFKTGCSYSAIAMV